MESALEVQHVYRYRWSMLTELDNYDWANVFAYCGEDSGSGGRTAPAAPTNGSDGGPRCYTREDVARILHRVDGENDGAEWWGVFEMEDGAFLLVSAGCDYTGWDCQASGNAWWADTLPILFQWGLGDAERAEAAHLLRPPS